MKKIIWMALLFGICLSVNLEAQELLSTIPDSLTYEKPALKNSIIKPLLKHLFVLEKDVNDSLNSHSYINIDYFRQFEGYKIKTIRVQILSPFADLSEEIYLLKHFKNTANSLHIKTKENVVLNHLMFKEGESIDPYVFAESERFLRRNNYIFDAGIIVNDNPETHEAEIFVFVQDVWNVQISAAYNNQFNKGNTQIKDINFLGMGGSLIFNIKNDPEYKKGFKPDFEYKYSRLFDKFGEGKLYYYSNKENIQYGFGANQNYVQNWLKVLGGINSDWYRNVKSDLLTDQFPVNYSLDYNENDLWMGYNFSLSQKEERYFKYNNLIVAARIIDLKYSKKPDSIAYYQDNHTILTGLCFLNRYFYQDNYLFAFGKTEDIPVGKKLQINFGKQNGVLKNRYYLSFNSTIAEYSSSWGYFLNNINYGSFIKDKKTDNAIFDWQVYYFTKLFYLNNFKSRHYLNLKYSRSIKPYEKKQLFSLDKESGINGFENLLQDGDKRLLAKMEHDIYTPFTIIGFNTAIIQFADLALLSSKGENIIDNPLKSAIGIGLRFKNERLVFSTIQFTIAYYPNSSLDDMEKMRYYTERQNYNQFDKMSYHKPEIFSW